MDYILIYKDGRGKKMAAIPDSEGVYTRKIPFIEFGEDLTTIEVIILKIDTASILDSMPENEEDDCIEGEIVGKFVASKKISDCIKNIGFEKFFTTMIKEFLAKEDTE